MKRELLLNMDQTQLIQYRNSLMRSIIDAKVMLQTQRKQQQNLRTSINFLKDYAKKLDELSGSIQKSNWTIIAEKSNRGVQYIKNSHLPQKASGFVKSLPNIYKFVLTENNKSRLRGIWGGVSGALSSGFNKSKQLYSGMFSSGPSDQKGQKHQGAINNQTEFVDVGQI